MHIQFNPYGALVLHPDGINDNSILKAFKEGKVTLALTATGEVTATPIWPQPTFKLDSTPVPDPGQTTEGTFWNGNTNNQTEKP